MPDLPSRVRASHPRPSLGSAVRAADGPWEWGIRVDRSVLGADGSAIELRDRLAVVGPVGDVGPDRAGESAW